MEKIIKSKERNQKRAAEIFFICVMLALPISSFLVFWLYVNFNSILMAFQIPLHDGMGGIEWSFGNFTRFFTEFFQEGSILLTATKNTLIFFASNVFIVIPIAVFMCYFLYKKVFLYRTFRFIFFLPSIIMATVLVVLYRYIIGPGGPLFAYWERVGKEPIEFLARSKYAFKTILFYTIFTTIGGNLVLLSGAMKSIDESIIEAGKLDGVGMFREIFQIIIPIIWPTLSTMLVLASVGIFTASGPILLFKTQGQKKTNTIAYWIYQMVTGERAGVKEEEYASAVGLVFTLIGLPIVLLIRKLLNSLVAEVEY